MWWEVVDWTRVDQDREKRQAIANMLMNFMVP
jgi:hypothetical protein